MKISSRWIVAVFCSLSSKPLQITQLINNTSHPTQQSYHRHYNYNQPDVLENQASSTTGTSSIRQTGTSTVQESKSTELNYQSNIANHIASTREVVQQSAEKSSYYNQPTGSRMSWQQLGENEDKGDDDFYENQPHRWLYDCQYVGQAS